MNQRLLWNFEFSQKKPFPILDGLEDTSDIKWEIRYFWTEAQIIKLYNIDAGLLDISHYKQKQKDDTYFLIPGHPYNIKLRRFELLYKPIIKQTDTVIGFGPKIPLEDVKNYPNQEPETILHLQNILQYTQNTGVQIRVKKESFTYKFKTKPSTKLELAKLEVNQKIYFSACIEGKSRQLVELINEHLFHQEKTQDYITFLKSVIPS